MICEINKPLIKSDKKITNIQCEKKKNPSAVLRQKYVHYLQEHGRSNEDFITKISNTISASTSDTCSVNEINLGKHNL